MIIQSKGILIFFLKKRNRIMKRKKQKARFKILILLMRMMAIVSLFLSSISGKVRTSSVTELKHSYHHLTTRNNSSKGKSKGKTKGGPKFDVIVTSYEVLMQDSHLLRQFNWAVLIVDEGQRLKNHESKLFQMLFNFHTDHRVLLTGTPLQNNLVELYCLMNFLKIDTFSMDHARAFEEEFSELSKEKVKVLHELLRPHILRRLKNEIELDNLIPPKAIVIVPVSMTSIQKVTISFFAIL